jgi:anti-anti-sigma factor
VVTFKEEGGTLTCFFSGPMDSITSVQAEQETTDRIKKSSPVAVRFDLIATEFVSSVFLRFCLTTYQQFGAEHFAILHPNETVQRVLDITHLREMVRTN